MHFSAHNFLSSCQEGKIKYQLRHKLFWYSVCACVCVWMHACILLLVHVFRSSSMHKEAFHQITHTQQDLPVHSENAKMHKPQLRKHTDKPTSLSLAQVVNTLYLAGNTCKILANYSYCILSQSSSCSSCCPCDNDSTQAE